MAVAPRPRDLSPLTCRWTGVGPPRRVKARMTVAQPPRSPWQLEDGRTCVAVAGPQLRNCAVAATSPTVIATWIAMTSGSNPWWVYHGDGRHNNFSAIYSRRHYIIYPWLSSIYATVFQHLLNACRPPQKHSAAFLPCMNIFHVEVLSFEIFLWFPKVILPPSWLIGVKK